MKYLSVCLLTVIFSFTSFAAENESFKDLCNYYKFFEEEKDTANMVKVLKRGFKLYPEESYFVTNLLALYITERDYYKGLTLLKKAVKRTPNDPLYWYLYGQFNEAYGEYEKGENNYLQALNIDPEHVGAMVGMGSIYYRRGMEKIEQGKKKNVPEDVYLDAAKPSFMIAVQYLEKGLSLQNDNYTAVKYLLDIYGKTGDTNKLKDMQKRIENLQE